MRYPILLLLMVGTLSLTACGGSSAESEKKIEGVVPETLSFEADDLVDLYERDEVAADASVKGMLVEVTGPVASWGTNESNVAYVIVGTKAGLGVQCVFTEPGPQESFSDLTTAQGGYGGSRLTVRGIGEGKSELVYEPQRFGSALPSLADKVTLSDCFVVK